MRVLLIVAYDGTKYCGWQRQPAAPTVEETLCTALGSFFHKDVSVIGASRTDSGVHALGNVAVFDIDTPVPADKIAQVINPLLPPDIVIQKSFAVREDFHPRRTGCVKTYEYRIFNAKVNNPLISRYADYCYVDLDVGRMREAADYLVGEHDFTSFCSADTQADNHVRTIYSLDVEKSGDLITIRIRGNGFLYNMVRIIAGTLMQAGRGFIEPHRVKEILEAKDRQAAGPTAAAKGLTLVNIEYEEPIR